MKEDDRANNEIEKIQTELSIVNLLLNKVSINSSLDEIETRAAALSLISIYGGSEKILTIKMNLRGLNISSDNWHKDLLLQSREHNIISEDLF